MRTEPDKWYEDDDLQTLLNVQGDGKNWNVYDENFDNKVPGCEEL